jgi:hypothetical protein
MPLVPITERFIIGAFSDDLRVRPLQQEIICHLFHRTQLRCIHAIMEFAGGPMVTQWSKLMKQTLSRHLTRRLLYTISSQQYDTQEALHLVHRRAMIDWCFVCTQDRNNENQEL